MSLINQMLRDLEQRQVASRAGPQLAMGQANVSRGTSRHRWQMVSAALGLMLTVAGTAWYYSDRQTTPGMDGLIQADPATPALQAPTAGQPLPVDPIVETETIQPETDTKPEQPMVDSTPIQPVEAVQPSHEEPRETAVAEAPKPKPDAPKPVANKRPVPTPEQARLAYQAAQQLLQQGRTDVAISRLQQALHLQPGWREPRTLLATVYLEQGRNELAQTLLSEGLSQQPGYAGWAMLQARLLLQSEGPPSAIGVLERTRQAGAGDLDMDLFLAALYQRAQRHQQAVTTYQDVLAGQPNHAKAWLGMAISLEGLGQPHDALAAYQEALRLGGHQDSIRHYIEQRISDLGA